MCMKNMANFKILIMFRRFQSYLNHIKTPKQLPSVFIGSFVILITRMLVNILLAIFYFYYQAKDVYKFQQLLTHPLAFSTSGFIRIVPLFVVMITSYTIANKTKTNGWLYGTMAEVMSSFLLILPAIFVLVNSPQQIVTYSFISDLQVEFTFFVLASIGAWYGQQQQ